MKKLALLAALMATLGLAQADSVSVFGIMDGGYISQKNVGSTATTSGFNSGGMSTSAWGIKGTEDVDTNTKAVFEVSSFLDLNNGQTLGGTTPNLFARSAFVGLQNKDLGGVTMGRQSNPSFLPTILFNAYGDSGSFGPLWHATYFGNNNIPTTQIVNDTAWDGAVTYTTPTIVGATGSYSSARGATGGTNSGANLLWFSGPFAATAYYQQTEFNSSGSFQTDIFTAHNNKPATVGMVGGSFDAVVAKIFATYQDAKDTTLAMDGKTYQVSGAIPVGAGKVLAEYANTKYNTNTKYAETVVGYDYNLSKKVDVYANAGYETQTAQTSGHLYGAGLRVKF